MIQSKKLILWLSLLAICVSSAPVDDEDDVELNDEQLEAYTTDDESQADGPNLKLEKYRWPKTKTKPYHVIVPIQIRVKNYTKEALANFRSGLKDIESKTCVRFVDHTDQEDFILVHDAGDGKCASKLGKVGGKQKIKLTNDCMIVRKKCVHEVIHSLGFHHMHQRYDRDKFLTIKWENIIENAKHNFNKYKNKWEAYDTPYDYLSCMHYAKYGFSKNGSTTIETKDPTFQDVIGVQFTLSDADAYRINRMYKCPKRKANFFLKIELI